MSSAIDLTLALIEDDHSAELSRAIARKMVVYHRRPAGQSQFSALLELEPRSDRVRRALVYAKEHLRNPLTVEELAEAASISPRQFSRVFREETGQSPAKAVRATTARSGQGDARRGASPARHRRPRHRLCRPGQDASRLLRFFGQPPQSLRRSLKLIDGEEGDQEPRCLTLVRK